MTTKIEELQAQIANAESQIVAAETNIATEQQKGSEANAGIIQREQELITALREDVTRAQTAIAEEEQADRVQAQESKVEQDIQFNIPGVDLSILPAPVFQLINIIVKNDRRRLVADFLEDSAQMQAQHAEQIRAAEERETNLKFQNDQLQGIINVGKPENERLTRENGDLREYLSKVNLEKADIEKKRDAATAKVDEMQVEIDRLNRVVDEMRVANIHGERAAQKIIDVAPEPDEDVQSLVNSIRDRYVSHEDFGTLIKVNKDDGTFVAMKRDEFESLQLPTLPPPSLPVPQETPFQGGVPTTGTDGDSIPAAPPIAVNSFREDEDAGIPTNAADSQMAGSGVSEVVSRAEFNELAARVARIEAHANIPAVA